MRLPLQHSQCGQQRMEPLWSPVVATGGNQSQIRPAPKRRKQAKTVAVGCDQLPREVHGKQGVCGGLPPVAAGPLPASQNRCRWLRPVAARSNGKEGSTVRVRQRALQKPCRVRLFFRLYLHDSQRAVGMEPFMEPSGREARLDTDRRGRPALTREPLGTRRLSEGRSRTGMERRVPKST
jgi:hypothetical protein